MVLNRHFLARDILNLMDGGLTDCKRCLRCGAPPLTSSTAALRLGRAYREDLTLGQYLAMQAHSVKMVKAQAAFRMYLSDRAWRPVVRDTARMVKGHELQNTVRILSICDSKRRPPSSNDIKLLRAGMGSRKATKAW
ncbi:hypothetical protein TWF694_011730 [Orbilia ellipsospora]|uniref:Uncharacterized protein n=1 Tax=Orbilia ellipsospora TaxID=2528407 RepID=A0AAV9X642_9PEZI